MARTRQTILIFVYNQMIKLKEIFLARIADIVHLQGLQHNFKESDDETVVSQKVPKHKKRVLGHFEKQESDRLRSQILVMRELESLNLKSEETLRQFIAITLQIICAYDPSLEQNYQIIRQKELPVTLLHKIYKNFVFKHANVPQFKHITAYVKRDVCELNPVIYLGWLGQWSRGMLNDLVKFKRNGNPQNARINMELIRLVKQKMEDEEAKQSNDHLFLHSKQNFYGYFLGQMEEYYKRLEMLDLDMLYLKSIKKTGRKEDLLANNFMQSVRFILKKQNARAYGEIRNYSESHDAYMTKITKRKLKSLEAETFSRNKSNRFKSINSVTNKIATEQRLSKKTNQISPQRYQFKIAKQSSKVLFQQHCQRIQFPLIAQGTQDPIENVNSRRSHKKSYRRILRTKPEQRAHLRFFSRNDASFQEKTKKFSPVSLIISDQNEDSPATNPQRRLFTNVEVKFEQKQLETQFDKRRLSILRKIKQKDIDLNKKSQKIHIQTTFCFDDTIIKKGLKIGEERERLFMSDKGRF